MSLASNRKILPICIVVAMAVWTIYILKKPVEGFNYRLYKYFSELSESGIDVFRLGDRPGPFRADYLDFTPADLVIYKAVFALQHTVPRAWFAYQLLWGWLAAGLAWVLAARRDFSASQLWAFAIVLAISPAWLFLSALSGEDKLINAAVPLLIALLASEYTLAALVVGALYAGISGFGLLYMPLLAIACWHRWPGQWARLAALGALAAALIVLMWLPYWPENKVMLANRAVRESLPPFWYSIWMLDPGLFSPFLSKVLTLAVVAFASLGFLRQRTSLLAAIVAIAFAYFLTTNFLNHYRIVAMLFLPLLALRKGTAWWVYAGAVLVQLNVVLAYRLLHITFPGPDALPWPLELKHVALANMCLVTYLAMFFAGLTSSPRVPSEQRGSAPLPVASVPIQTASA